MEEETKDTNKDKKMKEMEAEKWIEKLGGKLITKQGGRENKSWIVTVDKKG